MKIGSRSTKTSSTSSAGRVRQAGRPSAGSPSAKASSTGDQVAIGATAARLGEIENELTASPAFDAQKVESIKQAIAKGEFKINPEAIADRLVNTVKELLVQKKK